MPRTIFLHIGSHKTGTTSIQNFLADNRELLAKRGYGVLGKSNSEDETSPAMGRIGRRKSGLAAILAGQTADIVIGSSEGFSYLNDAKEIGEFADLLRPHFSTIKIITYLRRQDQLAVSHHQEGANPQHKPAVRLHGYSPTALPTRSDLQHRYLDYATRIGLWADIFGDDAMIVRVYDRKVLKSGDSVADFLEVVGLGDLDISTRAEKNVSMGFFQSKVGHILNEIIENQHVKASVMSRLPREGKLLPRRDDAMRFVAAYHDSNRRLNERFKINTQPNLFSDDFSSYPEEGNEDWTEATADATIRACAEVIQTLAAGNTSFSKEELTAAAAALATSHPELSRRFMTAALAIRPNSKRLQGKAAALEDKLKRRSQRSNTTEDPVKPKDRRAEKRGARKSAAAQDQG
jgi:hypothetical protein